MREGYPDFHRGDNHDISGKREHTASAPDRSQRLRAIATSADWLAPAANPARVVLGVIVTSALLAAESGLHKGYPATFASAAIGASLYWVAHAYADVLGRRLHSSRRLTVGELWTSLMHESAVARGAAIPLAALLIAAVTGAGRETGVTAAIWTGVASIVVLELIAGMRSNCTKGELVLEAAVGVAMGLAVIALKAILAH